MSTQKILQINPELFKFSGGKKSIKGKKERKTKPIHDKNQSIKSNKIKKELLKKVKNYQKNKETEKIKEEKKEEKNSNSTNLFESSDFEDSDFEREFNKSLTFLHDLSKQNKEKKKKRTLKTSNIDVNIDIPKDSLIYNAKREPNFGCLKNGSKPTFKDLNKTQKNNIYGNNGKRLQISLENNTYYDHSAFHNKYDMLENELIQKKLLDEHKTNIEPHEQIEKQIKIQELANVELGENNDLKDNINFKESKSELEPELKIKKNLPFDNLSTNDNQISNFTNLIDNKIDHINDIDKSFSNININTSNINSDVIKTKNLSQIIHNEEDDIPKLRRITRTYKYKLGKKKDKKYIGLLVKNRETQKKIRNEVSKLKQQDIQSIKNYLREKNLIKLGSQAPNDVLRKLYEDSILSGEITNTNNNNLVYNYLND